MTTTDAATGTTTADLVVRPVRFTDDVPAMQAFLELLGLRPRIVAERGGWVDLVSAAGMVALHSAADSTLGARPGETSLSFEVADAEATRDRLVAAGFDAAVVDESYGRDVVVTDPTGHELLINEQATDLYGYRRLHPTDGSAATSDRAPLLAGVVPVCFADDTETFHRFLVALGLTGQPDPDYAAYDAGGHGWVGVHAAEPSDDHDTATALSLAVEPDRFDALEQRLRAAGLDVTRRDQPFGSSLVLVDPDGQSVEVHPTPH